MSFYREKFYMAKEKILNSLKSHILVFIRKVLKISILTIPFGVGGFYVKKKKHFIGQNILKDQVLLF